MPADLVAIVGRILDRDPARRQQIPTDVATELIPFCEEHDLAKLLETPLTGHQETITCRDTQTVPSFDSARNHGTPTKASTTGADEIVAAQPEAADSGNRSSVKILETLGAGAAALLLGAVLYMQFGKATLVVEIKDPTLTATVVSDGIEIEGNRESIRLAPGDHKLKVTRGDFTFETDNFALNRGEKEVLTVEYIEGTVSVVRDGHVIKAAEMPGAAPNEEHAVAGDDSSTANRARAAAEWVLKQHGEVGLASGVFASSVDDLPAGEFELTSVISGLYAINHPNQNSFNLDQIEILNGHTKLEALDIFRGMHDDALDRLDNLPSLTRFRLSGTSLPDDIPQITDRAIAMLARYPRLNYLSLTGVKMSDAGFATLFSCPEMKNLEHIAVAGTVIGEKGLQAAARLPRLRVLTFEGCANTTAAALTHLKNSTVEELCFYGAVMSADRLVVLAKVPQLNTLVLGGSNVTLGQLAPLCWPC